MALQLSPVILVASMLHVVTATGDETSRNTSCMPVRCGNLTIRYPFSLGGVQPLYCGYPVLDLTCDNGTAYLSRTFRDHLYRVKNISYETGTMAVTVEATFAGGAGCRIPRFNVTSSLAAYPFVISNTANKYLTFVYNYSRPQDVRHRLSCGNHTMEVYISDRWNSTGVPPNCSSVSVPVRGYHAGMPVNQYYEQLISDGFVLEWMRPVIGDRECEACTQMGGDCRFPQLTFECVCPNGLLCSNSTSGHQGSKKTGRRIILIEGSKRALLYEYMSNGSLDKYIYSENPKEILGWEKLYGIAIGIARGLEYLHHGCNTRIIHFDIKPQNILLDQAFCPKIADFGLAKLCRTKESKLSMTGARGTIGFIAPERTSSSRDEYREYEFYKKY
ncbi:hypothetical protein E2562_000837 [Oryza meyeriana var. granulata]|uniref:Protein kinase domain-containing protein n=1 Tax=Oryza meyeriana var. granulata TaxID=110450 RepID=A0A6G1CXU9_9ORYZ|nr:hypothetical protein E2562_000837 [Oryza meyeriana var. granulata]